MARVVLCCCLLFLLSVCPAQGLDDLPDNGDDNLVKSELDLTLDNGQKVHETSATDRDCHFQITSTEAGGDVISTVFNDLDDDLGLVLYKQSPHVCYLRPLGGLKSRCSGGYDKAGEPQVKVIRYVNGDEVKFEELPLVLQQLCEKRTVIRLVEDSNNQNVEDDNAAEDLLRQELDKLLREGGGGFVRNKRSPRKPRSSCRYVQVSECRYETRCTYCCSGWFLGKKCSNSCCTTHNVCVWKNVLRC